MEKIFWVFVFCCMTWQFSCVKSQTFNSSTQHLKKLKAQSIFNIIRFPNSECSTNQNLRGTCYTEQECSNKNGKKSGSCANGFGVCCVFEYGCGASTTENVTHFVTDVTATSTSSATSATSAASSCSLKVCKCNPGICQLRLDFISLTITGPSTITIPDGQIKGGNLVLLVAAFTQVQVSRATQCRTDTFSITSPGGSPPPVICGTNSGQHIYVDASDVCNSLTFQFGPTGLGAPLKTREWNIMISQKSCSDIDLAPPGCTQYYYGSGSGSVQSFNYDNNVLLANQIQNICFRREKGNCRLCFSPSSQTVDFQVSGSIASRGFVAGTKCCGYGFSNSNFANGYDCVIIPGATSVGRGQKPNSICGQRFGTVNSAATSTTICTMRTPFQLSFISDFFTYSPVPAYAGFKLNYWQTSC